VQHVLPVPYFAYVTEPTWPYSSLFKSDENSDMFAPLAPIFVGMHVFVASAGNVPRIDIENTCRVSENTTREVFDNTGVVSIYESCMATEKASLERLIKDWATYPAETKVRCVQPKVFMPNYSEWLTCLEMERDVRKMRLGNPNPSVPVKSRSRRQKSG